MVVRGRRFGIHYAVTADGSGSNRIAHGATTERLIKNNDNNNTSTGIAERVAIISGWFFFSTDNIGA